MISDWLKFHPRVAPNAPIDEFKRSYAFLDISESNNLDDDSVRQRYVLQYRQFKQNQEISLFITITVVIYGVVLFIYLHGAVDLPTLGNLDFLWPPNYQLRIALSVAKQSENATNFLTFTNLMTSGLWIVYFLYSSIDEITRSDYFLDKRNEVLPILLFFFICLGIFYAALQGPSTPANYFGSTHDSVVMLSLKHLPIVVAAYVATTFWVSVVITKIRMSIRDRTVRPTA